MKPKDRLKNVSFPVLVVFLLGVTLAMGAGTGIVSYANGKEVAGETHMMMVSHTEYRFAEEGQIIARLVNFQGAPIAVDNCTATILYPDKTLFVDEELMSDSVNITGDHYYNFTTPNGPEGVYEYQATCAWNGGAQERSVTNSFHLSGAFNTLDGNLTDIDTVLVTVQNNLTQLSTDLFAVNGSLSAEIADLSSQLNANTSTILTELSAVNTSLSNDIAGITQSVLDALISSSYYVTEEDYTNAVDSELWCGIGSDCTIVLGGDVGAEPNPLGGQQYDLQGTDAYLVLNSSAWSTTDEERYGDTTYEVWVYDRGYGLANGGDEDWYVSFDHENFDAPYVGAATNSNNAYWAATGSGVSSGPDTSFFVAPRTEGWHLFQLYWSGQNGTHGNIEISVDGFLVRSELGVPLPTVDDFFVYHYASNNLTVDNMRIYEGRPDATSALALKARETLANTENILSNLTQFQSDVQANLSTVINNQDAVIGNVSAQTSLLTAINTTTVNTYDYMTGTLATNVDSILTQLGVINATVNRIETTTNQINTTVTDILANQEDEVIMTTFSG